MIVRYHKKMFYFLVYLFIYFCLRSKAIVFLNEEREIFIVFAFFEEFGREQILSLLEKNLFHNFCSI